jgi:hypothetical protein
MNGAWNDLFTGVSRANLVINAVNNGEPGQEQAVAELRTLRAWYYYLLMDFFGGVPIVTTTEIAAAAAQLARLGVRVHREGADRGARASATAFKAADALRPRHAGRRRRDPRVLYLNAQVYRAPSPPPASRRARPSGRRRSTRPTA